MVSIVPREQTGHVTGITQMGGEGAQWIGTAPFVEDRHFFQNMGDGTFFHSGQLSVQAAVASGTTMTFKILYNAAVAMTGGQDAAGLRSVPEMAQMLMAEGVKHITITTDDPSQVPRGRSAQRCRCRASRLPSSTRRRSCARWTVSPSTSTTSSVRPRSVATASAASSRRPTFRVMIDERVCEACGDCGVKSNCLSLHSTETEFGRKTVIDQASCNVDASCLKGDCPAFITVQAGQGEEDQARRRLRDRAAGAEAGRARRRRHSHAGHRWHRCRHRQPGAGRGRADCRRRRHDRRPDGSVAEGGSGGVDGDDRRSHARSDRCAAGIRRVGIVDARQPRRSRRADQRRGRLDQHRPDRSDDRQGGLARSRPVAVPRRAGQANRRRSQPVRRCRAASSRRCSGNAVTANVFMVGVAYQAGLIPLPGEAIERAIELNGTAVEANLAAFRWGRRWTVDPGEVEKAAGASIAYAARAVRDRGRSTTPSCVSSSSAGPATSSPTRTSGTPRATPTWS